MSLSASVRQFKRPLLPALSAPTFEDYAGLSEEMRRFYERNFEKTVAESEALHLTDMVFIRDNVSTLETAERYVQVRQAGLEELKEEPMLSINKTSSRIALWQRKVENAQLEVNLLLEIIEHCKLSLL